MIDLIRVLIIAVITIVFVYPFLHIRPKTKLFGFFNLHARSYDFPNNKRNIFYVPLAILEIVLFAVLFQLIDALADLINNIPFLGRLIRSGLDSVSPQVDFIAIALRILIVYLITVFVFLFISSFLKKILDGVIGLSDLDRMRKERKAKRKEKKRLKKLEKLKKKRAKKGGPVPTEDEVPEEEEEDPKNKRVQKFKHIEGTDPNKEGESENGDGTGENGEEKKAKKPHSRFYRAVVGLFFREETDFLYARRWLVRANSILQLFLYLIEILYFGLILSVFLGVLYPMDRGLYSFLVDTIRFQNWYFYPAVSIILLQFICYFFKTKIFEGEAAQKAASDEPSESEMEANLAALHSTLKKRFDKEHGLRYYPEAKSQEEPPYVCTNKQFASALDFIGRRMYAISGRTVQSYMKTLDTMYGGDHIYVAAPFYSEFGEYVISYTYTRLLAGARVVFMIGNDRDAEMLKKYIRSRLSEITGSTDECTWRVYTADERLDQADVYIATPNDFKSDNIVEHYPAFFEEVCNAIFINADDIIAQESYLCCIIASRLMNGSGGRVRFLFLSDQMLYGFAASTLPKFFCVETVLNMSDATQVESVSYTLWNRESANGRIYDKTGHKLTGLESIIAEQAYIHGVDGVKILTAAVLENAEQKIMEAHGIEINNFFKPIPKYNFLIYSDEYFNLAAVLFAATRFRGKKKSIAHIISRPYLLRDYFVSKATREDFVKRASFIQPRMAEHINQHKLSLLRIFCDLTGEGEGRMSLSTFEARMRDVISLAKKREDVPPCAFCANLLKEDVNDLTTEKLVAYLIAGLCDNEKTPIYHSEGNQVKNYYLVTNSTELNGYSFVREKLIYFKHVKNILDRAILCNKRVELRLNDEIIGVLPYIFPKRVPLEYMVGMSIVYNNTEYEIEQITYSSTDIGDGSSLQSETCTIFLRCENVTFKNCLDTIFLRRYTLGEAEPLGLIGIRHNSTSTLSEIRVQKLKLDFVGRTYGFYSLMSDRQTIDFYKGVEGNYHLDPRLEEGNLRVLKDKKGRALMLTLTSKEECTDGMRMLLSAVFNELLRALFPKTYRCVAVCPVLAEPLPYNAETCAVTPEERIQSLYPFLEAPSEEFIETDPNRIRLLFINDCEEDVGVLDWIFDPVCRYIQEWLVYIYSYLHWLSAFPEKKHYIYFGGEKLPECYDLPGCLKLLENCKSVFSDSGAQDYDTANDNVDESELRRCSFCHRIMESGRYQTFNTHRYICADCFDVVSDATAARATMEDIFAYLQEQYPGTFAHSETIKLDPPYNLAEDQVLSEYYSRVDFDERVIYLEKDLPSTNAAVAVLRGMVALWQKDCNLVTSYAPAQLYFEELKYLRHIGQDQSANWIYENLPESLRQDIDLIEAYVKGDASAPWDDEESRQAEPTETRTSFLFMQEKAKELDDIEEETNEGDEDYSDELYDPDQTPRFWKRYLRGEQASGTEDVLPEDEREEDTPEGEDPPDDDPDDDGPDGDGADDDTSDSGEGPIGGGVRNDGFVPFMIRRYYLMEAPGFGDPDDDKKNSWKDDFEEESDPEDSSLDLTDEDSADEELSDEEPSDEEPFDEEPSDEEPSDEEPTDEEPSDEEPSDEEPSDEEPADEEPAGEEPAGEEPAGEEPAGEEPAPGKEPEKKKKKKDPWFKRLFKKKKPEEETDEDEATNPKIKLYNEIVRHAKAYSEEFFSREGLPDEEIDRIFEYVSNDYPELFWIKGYKWTATEMGLNFRCKDVNGNLDLKQIKRKRKEIKKGAKYFTRGISRRTSPYKAMLKIYRRLILTLDYDSLNVDTNISSDYSKDDVLRSLHSALVEHKVVCAGYAVAFQYLLQSVGITCATVTSEFCNQSGHAFNIVKIGKFCYYVDPTWGDPSDTAHNEGKNEVHYGYFCVPEREFRRTTKGKEHDHIANKKLYPTLEELKTSNHEYHRYFKSFFSRVDDDEIAKAIAYQTLLYNEKEMGDFIVSLRFITKDLANYVIKRLLGSNSILDKAYAAVAKKNRKKAELLTTFRGISIDPYTKEAPSTGVIELFFEQPKKKKKKNQKDA